MKIQKVPGARVVVERVEAEKTLASGLILPDKVAEENRARQGVVVLVGDGVWTDKGEKIPMTVQVGDTVLYRDFAGVEMKEDDKTYVIINEGDILAIVESK